MLIERAAAGVPLLGICLGMQLLFESTTEHEGAQGLGILPGAVTRLESPRLPHIGWNLVTFERESTLTEGLGEAAAFYHVHSFACRPSDPPDVVGTSEYGERFVSVVEREGGGGGGAGTPRPSTTCTLSPAGRAIRPTSSARAPTASASSPSSSAAT